MKIILKYKLDRSEWKVSTCECSTSQMGADGIICSSWQCTEKGMDYYLISMLDFHLSYSMVSFAGILIFIGVSAKIHDPKSFAQTKMKYICMRLLLIFISLVACAGLILVSFILGGVMSIILTCSIWMISLILICKCFHYLCSGRKKNYQQAKDDYMSDAQSAIRKSEKCPIRGSKDITSISKNKYFIEPYAYEYNPYI